MDIKLPIGNTLRPDGLTVGSQSRGSPSATDATATSPRGAAGEESITLTETAKTLNAVRDGARDTPFDRARVAEIRSALAEGRYEIDHRRLAERMLEFERALA
ncbi:MAG: flagellar biosynthesis anti-sigma factor FlgM [Thermochromatium sp.]